MSAIGAAKISANSFNAQFGRSSGRSARDVLISHSLRATDCSVTTIGWSPSVDTRSEPVQGGVGQREEWYRYKTFMLTKSNKLYFGSSNSSSMKVSHLLLM